MTPNNAFDDDFDAAGQAYNVDPQLIKTVFHLESGGNPGTPNSNQGAQGGMQMLSSTATAMGASNPHNMKQAIPAAAAYLAQGLQATGSPEGALAYYHAGPDPAQHGPKTAAYVAKGQQLYAQVPLTSPANNNAAAPPASPGEDILKAYQAPAPAKATAAPVQQGPGEDILSAYSSAAAPAVKQASDDAANAPYFDIPAVHDFAAGAAHGAQSLADTLNRGAAYVDRNVPFLARLDKAFGQTPQAAVDQSAAAEPAYQAKFGNSYVASAGDFLGRAVATAPFLVAGGAGLGVLGGAAAEGVGGAASMLGRGVQAGTDLLTGTGAAPGAGFAGNTLARGVALSTGGAVQGAAFGGLTGGDVRQNALLGAALGPVAGTVKAGAVGAWRIGGNAGSRAVNALTGRGIPGDIERALTPQAAPIPNLPNTPAPASPLGRVEPPPIAGTKAAGQLAAAPPAETSVAAPPVAAPSTAPNSPVAAPVQPVTSEPLPPLTADQTAAAKATGEMQRLITLPPLGRNDASYVAGVKPTEAEMAGDPNISVTQAQIRNRNPTPFDTQEADNQSARINHFNDLAGDPSSMEAMTSARSQQAESDLSAAFSNKSAVDAQPVVDQINAVLNSRAGKLPPVVDAMQKAMAGLHDSKGLLEADPELLYGARQNVGYLMSKTAQQEKPGLREATSQLQSVKDALDKAIEPGAPGYQKYLSNYAAASKPIDAQELLQAAQPTIATPQGMTLSRVQNLLRQVVTQRQAPGVNQAKSIDDATLGKLFDLRDDLARRNNMDLGKSRGSNTNQNEAFSESLGLGAAQLAASHIPFGNALLGRQLDNVKSQALGKFTNRLLNPPPAKP